MKKLFFLFLTVFAIPLSPIMACDVEKQLYGSDVEEVAIGLGLADFSAPLYIDRFELPVSGSDICQSKVFSQGIFTYIFLNNQLVEISYKDNQPPKPLIKTLEKIYGENPNAQLADMFLDSNIHLFWAGKDSTVLFYQELIEGVLFNNIKFESKKFSDEKLSEQVQQEEVISSALSEGGTK